MGAEIGSFTSDTPVGWTETAIATEVDGELVALDITKGVCYGLNEVGTRIWQLLETPRSARELAGILVTEFDVCEDVCLEQTSNLLRELLVAELVR
jgi:hypothetical protein